MDDKVVEVVVSIINFRCSLSFRMTNVLTVNEKFR